VCVPDGGKIVGEGEGGEVALWVDVGTVDLFFGVYVCVCVG
jgi:hypothetical protein